MESKTRTIKELLQLMLENKEDFETGLCSWRWSMYSKHIISYEEDEIIIEYLGENKPIDAGLFWFPEGEIEPRIEWLEQQIEKL